MGNFKAKTIQVNKIKVSIAAVLFVPQTPKGKLAKLLRAQIESVAPQLGWKFKVVEKAGISIKAKIVKSNPWAVDMCGEENCNPCRMAGKPIECRKRNLVCETRYINCEVNSNSKKFVYVGESARSSKERVSEHIGDWKVRSEKSHLWKHHNKVHGSQVGELAPKFSYKVNHEQQG